MATTTASTATDTTTQAQTNLSMGGGSQGSLVTTATPTTGGGTGTGTGTATTTMGGPGGPSRGAGGAGGAGKPPRPPQLHLNNNNNNNSSSTAAGSSPQPSPLSSSVHHAPPAPASSSFTSSLARPSNVARGHERVRSSGDRSDVSALSSPSTSEDQNDVDNVSDTSDMDDTRNANDMVDGDFYMGGGGVAPAPAPATKKLHARGVSWDFGHADENGSAPPPPQPERVPPGAGAGPGPGAVAAIPPRESRAPPVAQQGQLGGGGGGEKLMSGSIFQPDLTSDSPRASPYCTAREVVRDWPNASPGWSRTRDVAIPPASSSSIGPPRNARKPPTKITLADVSAGVGAPFETEAENAILRALETREWEHVHDENARYMKALAHVRNATAEDFGAIMFGDAVLPEATVTNLIDVADNGGGADGGASSVPAAPATDGASSTQPALGADSRDAFTVRTNATGGPVWAGKALGGGDGDLATSAKPTLHSMARQLRKMQMGAESFAAAGAGSGAGTGGGYLQNFRAAAASRRNLAAGTPADDQSLMRSSTSSPPTPYVSSPGTEPYDLAPEMAAAGVPGALPISSADALVNDAAILLAKEEGGDIFVDLEAQTARKQREDDAARNLAKIRGVVRATGAFRRSIAANRVDEEGGGGDQQVGRAEVQLSSDQSGRKKMPDLLLQTRQIVRKSNNLLDDVLKPKWSRMKLFFGTITFFVILPMLIIASILYYVVGNPIAGCNDSADESRCASYSWWIIFLGIRQVITLSLAKVTEIIFVDILALRTKLFLRIVGPYITLLAVQSKGWPFIITYWAVWDFVMLYGNRKFSMHWLFWQRAIGMMSPSNPAGMIVYSDIYQRVLIAVIVFGTAVGLKRGWLALYLGRNSVQHYGPQLEKLMRKMLLISEVSHLSEEIKGETYLLNERASTAPKTFDFDALRGRSLGENEDEDDESQSERVSTVAPPISPKKSFPDNIARIRKNTLDAVSKRSGITAFTMEGQSPKSTSRPTLDRQSRAYMKLGSSAKTKLLELIGDWEEPEIAMANRTKDISIQEVLQFRQAVLCLDGRYPFSAAFGPARTRETCIESAQAVFEDLVLRTPDSGDFLPFETLSLIALKPNGDLDDSKAKRLIRLFRPDRDGKLSALDFVKSVDKVYKTLRTQRAAIANSSQIDRAFEQIVNVIFYFVLWLVALTIVKLDPWTLFLSLSGFILSFAFMFGAAASKYFEGILLVLVRRPYDIGDRVAVSNPQNDTNANGSSTWYVEGVGLFTTTVRFATTNEVATYSNGSLASMRIINAMRSPKASVYIYLKFAVDIPFERVMIFKSVIEAFVKDRPRQWVTFNAFRATRVEADLGFIEYVLSVQHVEAWQNIGPILTSKAELASYCLEVQKKLDMRYTSPPMPVNLALVRNNLLQEPSPFESDEVGKDDKAAGMPDLGALSSLFVPQEQKKTK